MIQKSYNEITPGGLIISRNRRQGISLIINGIKCEINIIDFSPRNGVKIQIKAPKEVKIVRNEIKAEDGQKA